MTLGAPPVVETHGLTKSYRRGVRALDGLDLTAERGLFGLLGPNGSGKSTLMRTLATLQRPDQGSIEFSGIDVLKAPQRLREQLGYLPQEFGVYPRISARDLLDYIARFRGHLDGRARKRRVAALLDRVNLTSHADREVASFSGGMRQRFGVAQALLGEPRLLIVDEPTAGLDPAERGRLHQLLSELGDDALVLLSTHIVEDVASICEHVAILAQGRIALRGRPGELLEPLRGRLWQRRLRRSDLGALAPRPLHVRPQPGAVQAIVVAAEWPGEGWEAKAPDLEDVYHDALHRVEARGETAG